MAKVSKVNQPKLPGMPKPTPLENASRDLLVAREELESAKTNVDRKIAAMVDALEADGRTSFIIEGYTIAVNITAARKKLTVKSIEKQ